MIGSGGFSLVENAEGLSNYYSDNKHCIYFDKVNENLITTIKYWLADENNAKLNKIRINGFNHAHKQNSYQIKTQFFIKKIYEFLKLK